MAINLRRPIHKQKLKKLVAERMAAHCSFFPLPSSSSLSPSQITTPIIPSITTTLNSKAKRPFSVKCFRPPESDPPPAVQTFWKWLSDERVVSAKSPAKPGVVPEGLGLIAQRDIAKNEVVLEVPKREKLRDDSPWKSYIDLLPECTHSTIFWSEQELSELQGSQLLRTTLGVKELVKSEFQKAKEEVLIPHWQLFPSPVTLDDFFWAFGMLRSRAFTRLSGQSLVLIPLADLVNHSPSITTENYAWEIKGAGLFSRDLLFSLRSPVPVKAGDQVLMQYDLHKSNAELALDYGFIESQNERNTYTLTLEIPESDPFFSDKLDIAESNGMGETAYFDITSGQPLPPALLPYLRLVALGGTDAFLLESLFRNSIWGHLELPVSHSNEEHICQAVRNACRSTLSGYHTTTEEDEKLKEKGNLDPRLEIAVGIRLGEKKVLQEIDEIFRGRELELDGFEYYQERRLRQLGLVGEEGEIIFWESKRD
ncbi:hypothetical protein Nepgr_017133 [Nepenthes gracilis]|uniref:SET domain-containing protein n=1 Tax=Nepenthes gracilis TaxID=150966 RepID=A0AAD3SQL5_NEPGR|nr:hypothetical protein Nepgr_017133 [Nepenthes gracilis]